MNLHHLELFYYVARYEGIVRACARIPYGVQQPAVSAQLLAFERELGTTLFQRRPFRLTSAGELLYAHIAPFFNQLPDLEAKLRGEVGQELRLAGPAELLRFHVPDLAIEMRRKFPNLRLRILESHRLDARQLVETGEAMVAVNALDARADSGFRSKEFTSLPLALLHRRRRGARPAAFAGHLRRGDLPAHDLIAPPPRDAITRTFLRALRKRGLDWLVTIEASSSDQIAAYVKAGLGIGLWVAAPGVPTPAGVTVEPLTDFPRIRIGALWKGSPPPVAAAFLELLEERTKKIMANAGG